MEKDQEVTNLTQLLDRIDQAAQAGDRVTLGAVMEEVGPRSFGPLLLVAGLAALAPVIGDIPGIPTIIGIFVLLIAVQLLFGRKHFWLPRWLLKRSVASAKLRKALTWMRRPAQFIDRLLRPRITIFTHGAAIYVIAAACLVIAAAMPVIEVVPFSANLAGAALAAFGLAMIAGDGLVALLAFGFTGMAIVLVVYNLL
jgi:hypothetical protein